MTQSKLSTFQSIQESIVSTHLQSELVQSNMMRSLERNDTELAIHSFSHEVVNHDEQTTTATTTTVLPPPPEPTKTLPTSTPPPPPSSSTSATSTTTSSLTSDSSLKVVSSNQNEESKAVMMKNFEEMKLQCSEVLSMKSNLFSSENPSLIQFSSTQADILRNSVASFGSVDVPGSQHDAHILLHLFLFLKQLYSLS
jgi:hypothetical protein